MSFQLGQRIADKVVSEFNKFNNTYGIFRTPLYHSYDWTVLAGLVAVQNKKISLISLATGVKTSPDDARCYSAGRIVHDSQAEILCLRIFNWYLMEEIKGNCERKLLLESGENLEINGHLPATEDSFMSLSQQATYSMKFRLDPSIKLALYTSKLPCGDEFMPGPSMGGYDSATLSSKIPRVIRGRSNSNVLGVVRVKMSSNNITLSKSCSDKLCLRQYTGILNCINSLLVEQVFLDFLVLDEEQYRQQDFDRCFTRRIEIQPSHKMQALTFSESSYAYRKLQGKRPSAHCSAFCGLTNTVQILDQGLKYGTRSVNGTPRLSSMSILCRRNLWSQAEGQIPYYARYSEIKKANAPRQQLKVKARAELGFWPECRNDDFSIKGNRRPRTECSLMGLTYMQ